MGESTPYRNDMEPLETRDEVFFLMVLLIGSAEIGSRVELWEDSEPEFFFRCAGGEDSMPLAAIQHSLS